MKVLTMTQSDLEQSLYRIVRNVCDEYPATMVYELALMKLDIIRIKATLNRHKSHPGTYLDFLKLVDYIERIKQTVRNIVRLMENAGEHIAIIQEILSPEAIKAWLRLNNDSYMFSRSNYILLRNSINHLRQYTLYEMANKLSSLRGLIYSSSVLLNGLETVQAYDHVEDILDRFKTVSVSITILDACIEDIHKDLNMIFTRLIQPARAYA